MNAPENSTKSKRDEHELEKARLCEEIRSLKLQRLLAVLSTIGAIVAFFVVNHSKINRILNPPPKLKLVVEDPYIKHVGRLIIENTGKDKSSTLNTSVSAAIDWIPMKAGAYRLKLMIGDTICLDQDVILRAGDKQTVFIPKRNYQTIHVTVKNFTPRPRPGEPIQLEIESSGNGFIWVYDLSSPDTPKLTYPSPKDTAAPRAITAGKTFKIPDSEGTGIFASDKPTEEKLLVVVTSSNSLILANRIAYRMSAASTKASSGQIRENWGVSLVRYRVGL